VNVLIVGNGRGSWEMRGRQLGAQLGATVTSAPIADDWAEADVVVLVKRAAWAYAAHAHARGIPIVWDALDFWRQPAENGLTAVAARQILAAAIAQIRPALVIGATKAMAEAAGGEYLPHHGWAGLEPTEARIAVTRVGYDGSQQYLDHWRAALECACRDRGWTFCVNPPDLSTMDILVSLRGGAWDGWICRQWKSGVKVVNAMLAGRPVIAQHCAAMEELWPSGSTVETEAELAAALDFWADADRRRMVVESSRAIAEAYSLRAVAETYRGHLAAVVKAGAPCP